MLTHPSAQTTPEPLRRTAALFNKTDAGNGLYGICLVIDANHRTPEQILAAYPYLVAADIDACLSYAALRVDDEELAMAAA